MSKSKEESPDGPMHLSAAILSLGVFIALAALAAAIAMLERRRVHGRGQAEVPRAIAPAADGQGDGQGDGAAGEAALEQRQLAERTTRAERAEQLRNLLVSKMSHDIRTPLNSVITLSQLLGDGSAGPLSGDQRRYLEIINRSGQTLLALLNDILDLASLEAGRLEVEIAAVDLRELLRGVSDSCAAAARRKGLPLHLNLPRNPRAQLWARADEDRLRHVLITLVEHAIAETRNGYVELSADGDASTAAIRVADTSSGIAPEARAALYDDFLTGLGPFARRPTPPLALVVAGRLMKLMDGAITVDSTAGEGTTFTVRVPLAAEEPAPARPRGDDTAAAPAPQPASGTVLVIEDDEIERRRVSAILEGAGYDVVTASSGQEGLSLLAAGHFDAVVLDLVMPGMSGLDVLRTVRADEQLAGTPFIVLSALYMTKSERGVLGPGVAAVVRKGDATADELTTHLRRAVERNKRAPGERATAATAAASKSAAPPRARVLVVEDNVDNLFTIEQVLASLPVAIETAASGPEAVALCRQHPPDLIMMDVELPGMSGLEASRTIHALPECARVPIIALTADAMQGDRQRVLAADCSAYLAKPVQPLDVVSAVTRALQLDTH
jgi:CheY-like chemotaxis protein/signal transduction histidine kinase